MKIIIFLFIILTILLSCSLDRSNVLDPNGHDINIPPLVENFHIDGDEIDLDGFIYIKSTNGSVDMIWDNDASGVSGYYIYRSMDHDGLYILVADLNHIPSNEEHQTQSFTDNTGLVPDSWYYYKISAFNDKGLEGYRSSWKLTYLGR